MKVEQQIEWGERLLCVHAWGSNGDINSGAYRYICNYYKIPFKSWSYRNSFDSVCQEASNCIGDVKNNYAFDHILIDESQDFPDSFISLCAKVSRHTIYVAGDIFQSIFDNNIVSDAEIDFLLSKCYRTDPRTLMFAHGLGMGLFESKKLRWLDDAEWKACGYIVEKNKKGNEYKISREPLRRFEDIESKEFQSTYIKHIENDDVKQFSNQILEIISEIAHENPTLSPDDIGIIFVNNNKQIYLLADMLESEVPRKFGWPVNKAYETKSKVLGSLFISNRNNVKGLEFPFVVCITNNIYSGFSYRNALYMTMTRSFIQSYLVVPNSIDENLLNDIEHGMNVINKTGCMRVNPPTEDEKLRLKTEITLRNGHVSFFEFASKIFDEMKVMPIWRAPLMDVLTKTVGEDFDIDNVKKIAEFLYTQMLRKK